MIIQANQIFEGTMVAAGWDRFNKIRRVSLFTNDGEDIFLDHKYGLKKFSPFMNQKVRVRGDIISDTEDGRKVLVKRISKLGREGGRHPPPDYYEEYHLSDLIALSA